MECSNPLRLKSGLDTGFLPAFCFLPTSYSSFLFLVPAPLPKRTGRIDSLNYRRLSHVKWPEERLKKWKAAIIPASKLT